MAKLVQAQPNILAAEAIECLLEMVGEQTKSRSEPAARDPRQLKQMTAPLTPVLLYAVPCYGSDEDWWGVQPAHQVVQRGIRLQLLGESRPSVVLA